MIINLPPYGNVRSEELNDPENQKTVIEDLIYFKKNDPVKYKNLLGALKREFKRGAIPKEIYDKIIDEVKKVEYNELAAEEFFQKFLKSNPSISKLKELLKDLEDDYQKGLLNKEKFYKLKELVENQIRKEEKLAKIALIIHLIILLVVVGLVIHYWEEIKKFFTYLSYVVIGILAIIWASATLAENGVDISRPRSSSGTNNRSNDSTPTYDIPDGIDDIVDYFIYK